MPEISELLAEASGILKAAFADGTEEFTVLNGTENEPPDKGDAGTRRAYCEILRRKREARGARPVGEKGRAAALYLVHVRSPLKHCDARGGTHSDEPGVLHHRRRLSARDVPNMACRRRLGL